MYPMTYYTHTSRDAVAMSVALPTTSQNLCPQVVNQ